MSTNVASTDYGIRTFDLSEERENARINVSADNIAILEAEDQATIRINDPQNSAINVRKISSISIPPKDGREGIQRIYLSNPSGTGDLTLLTGFAGASGSTSTPSDETTDVSSRESRELGKVRLEDDSGALIKGSNPLPVSIGGNQSSLDTNAIQPTTGDSFPAQTVPAGGSVLYKADASNTDTILIDGTVPLQPGEGTSLDVSDVSVPTFDGNGSNTLYSLVEV